MGMYRSRLARFAISRSAKRMDRHVGSLRSCAYDFPCLLPAGIGLALAVLVAGLLQLDHGLWVVLGTLSVLRSNALATGRTTLQALAGTLAGFALGAAISVVIALLLWPQWMPGRRQSSTMGQ
jgi:Fusaric acid resistance protein-like